MRGIQNFIGGNDIIAEQVTHVVGRNAVTIQKVGSRHSSQSARKVCQGEEYFFVLFLLLKVQGGVLLFPYFVCLLLKGINTLFSSLPSRSLAFNSSCRKIQRTYHGHAHTPRWGGCEGVLHVRGLLRLALIQLAWPTRSLLQTLLGSSRRRGQGPVISNNLKGKKKYRKQGRIWIR